ncbi:MAG: MBL fold metallo-hydrolase [Nitrososphaerales archaeon]
MIIEASIFEQIPVGDQKNFSYLFAEKTSRNAAIFDPAWDLPLLLSRIEYNELKLQVIVNTHAHFDHIEGNEELKRLTGARVIMHKSSRETKDQGVSDGDEIKLGKETIMKFIHTPGHTPESMCIQLDQFGLVTGDTLFIGECGRVDLKGGDANLMYDSLEKLKALDPRLVVYPGHDYGAKKSTSLKEQIESNYTLAKRSRQEFLKFMKD